MKRITLLFLLVTLSWAAPAQTPLLILKLKDGGRYVFPLADIRKMTFELSTTAVLDPRLQDVVRNFALFQNYPNPFNPSTTIRYELPREGDVQLTIFAVTGQRVRSLSQGQQQAGIHEVVWDGTDDRRRPVASGLYVYRITVGQRMLQRKMLNLK